MRCKKHVLQVISLLLVMAVCFVMIGCETHTGNVEGTKPPVDEEKPKETKQPVNEEKYYGEMINYETDFQKNSFPFWRTNVMYNESTVMIQRKDGQISAKLLFTPLEIKEVRDVTLKKTYIEGKDYRWDKGTNTLYLSEGSEIPYFTENDLSGKDENGKQIVGWGDTAAGWSETQPWDSLGRSRFGNALYCVGPFYYEKQIAVTYEYKYGDWQGAATEYQGDYLPKTRAKLEAGERIKMLFYGDSIFTGCDASKMYGREPNQEYFFTLFKKALEEKYGNRITLSNTSVGGMDSNWGAKNAEKLAAAKNPDLVIIGFGMNDGGKTGDEFLKNIRSIMDTVRASNPDCEFILVASMVPNEKSGFLMTQGEFPEKLKSLQGEGVAFVDMFAVHNDILKVKDFAATSGNNINHPNDWLIRIYAMNLISCLVKL